MQVTKERKLLKISKEADKSKNTKVIILEIQHILILSCFYTRHSQKGKSADQQLCKVSEVTF